jgi:hypothetical protein|tara:strand:+ start:949 stop:1074 length:126 start_codon:yes stop_codon:yes gene_type:complete
MRTRKNNISTLQRIECLKGWMASNKTIKENRKKAKIKKSRK